MVRVPGRSLVGLLATCFVCPMVVALEDPLLVTNRSQGRISFDRQRTNVCYQNTVVALEQPH